MFDKQYKFYGRHAQRVNALTNDFDSKDKIKIFSRNIDVYVTAPIIGFLYKRTAEKDSTKNPDTGNVYDANVMGDRVINSTDDLMFAFQMIMLLDKEFEPDINERINHAFRNAGKEPEAEERFDSFVRGGVDVLYEKLIEDKVETQEIIEGIYEFVEDFQDRFNSNYSALDVLAMCTDKVLDNAIEE